MINVNLGTDWCWLKTHVFKEFETPEEAERWTYENMDRIKVKALEQRKELGVSEPIRRRVNMTNPRSSIGVDIAHLYITI